METKWTPLNRRVVEDARLSARSPTSSLSGSISSLQQGPSSCSRSCLGSAVRYFNRDTPRQTHHQMACRQGRRIYGRRVQGLLPRNRHPTGFRHNQFAAANRCVRTRRVDVVRDSPCMLVGSGLPPFLRGGRMMTASYLCSWIPHLALKMETPHKLLFG